MQCSSCEIPMLVENQVKESGFCFVWYRCPSCSETYLNKSPLVKEPQEEEHSNSNPITS